MVLTEDYTVRLDQFEGPLDLLLYLIRRAELDISVISVGQIADQYLRYLERVHEVDVELAGEFLVLAATLIEIKSRVVMPVDGEGRGEDDGERRGAEEEDPGAVLVRQLLAYKKYRDAADRLEERRESWERCFPNGRAAFDRDAALRSAGEDGVDDEDLDLVDLIQAFRKIIETVQFDRLGDHEITYDDTPIAEHEADLMDRLGRAEGGRLAFGEVFRGRSRAQMIGLFLAVLELVRQRAIAVRQEGLDGEIHVRLREPAQGEAEGAVAGPVPAGWDDDHIFDGDDDEDEEMDASA